MGASIETEGSVMQDIEQTAAEHAARRAAATEDIRRRTGIDEDMIERLVRAFYVRVQDDAVLGPVFAASERIMRERADDALDRAGRTSWDLVLPCAAQPDPLALPAYDLSLLTPAELKVARLVARGLSYKEVARQLDRSLSTVNHQLRRIREKLGARSTAGLVRLIAAHSNELGGA